MDAPNFLKFWRHAAIAVTSTSVTDITAEPDNSSEEDDSFFDLELTAHDFDYKANDINNSKIDDYPQDKTAGRGNRGPESRQEGLLRDDHVSEVPVSLSANEPISKRKILPIEPISKPQSPIALLKSAPSFRIFMFKKGKEMSARKSEEMVLQEKERNPFAIKFDVEESPFSPMLSRSGSSSRNHRSKSDRFSKEVLHKYLKLIKPLYGKIARKNSEKVKFSGDLSSASTTSSPSVASVSLRKEKQGNITAGIRGACKHLGKSKSASASATGMGSPASRSDDTLLLQHDGIQSAILHCKRSYNSRDYASTVAQTIENSICSVRKSFAGETEANI